MHIRDGSASDGVWSVAVTRKLAGWEYAALHVLTLPPGGSHAFHSGEEELLVVPLAGSATVNDFELTGRDSVFTGVTDFCYLPRDCQVTVHSESGGRFAVPSAPARRRLPPRYGPAGDIPVELRGAGSCSRQVNNIASADSFECDRLLVVEVLTPGGNWSSYPPHKHDRQTERESALEEIYYFEVAGAGVGYQRVYASSPDRPIDVLAEVRTGDVVLVPYGWHGPSMASPGYDLYYLNAMAGPGPERAWRFCDDPAHGWVRDTWSRQPVDPRLPLTSAGRSR